MNDRLMLAGMATNGLLSSGRLRSLDTNRIAIDALAMADALLAAAGEQEPCARCAELEAKLAAAAALARDSAEQAMELPEPPKEIDHD